MRQAFPYEQVILLHKQQFLWGENKTLYRAPFVLTKKLFSIMKNSTSQRDVYKQYLAFLTSHNNTLEKNLTEALNTQLHSQIFKYPNFCLNISLHHEKWSKF